VIRLNNPAMLLIRPGCGRFLIASIYLVAACHGSGNVPSQTSNRTSQTVLTEPVASGGIGCLTIIVVPIIIVLLAITICLIRSPSWWRFCSIGWAFWS
jgi:hypothetical protein